jgi:hypothetical protein
MKTNTSPFLNNKTSNENRLVKMHEPSENEFTGGLRQLRGEDIHNLNFPASIVGDISSTHNGTVKHVSSTSDVINPYKL